VIAEPPSETGAAKAIEIDWSSGVAEVIVGASGTVTGVTLSGVEPAPLPIAFTARIATE